MFIEAELIGGTTGADTDVFVGGRGHDTLWLVLGTSTAAKLGDDLTGPAPCEALAALGIEAAGIEEIRIIEERSGPSVLSQQAWYNHADLWGLFMFSSVCNLQSEIRISAGYSVLSCCNSQD